MNAGDQVYFAFYSPVKRGSGSVCITAHGLCISEPCDDWRMPSRSSKPKRTGTAHDFTTVARRVVEQAIGEKLDGSPLDDPLKGKNPAAVALGKLGGAKGGAARAKALSPTKRREIAQRAANARWRTK